MFRPGPGIPESTTWRIHKRSTYSGVLLLHRPCIIGLMCQFSISYTVVTHVVSDDHDASCSNTRLPDTICAPPVLHSTKRLHTHHAITVSKINATHHNYFPVIRFAMFAYYYDHQALVNLSTHLLASNTSGAPVTAHTSAGSSRSYTFIHSTLWLTLGIT